MAGEAAGHLNLASIELDNVYFGRSCTSSVWYPFEFYDIFYRCTLHEGSACFFQNCEANTDLIKENNQIHEFQGMTRIYEGLVEALF